MPKKNKPRWKDLTFYERFAKRLKQKGACEEICEHYREKGRREKEKESGYIVKIESIK